MTRRRRYSSPEAIKRYKKNGKFPCGVCSKGVGRNSIRCPTCAKWVHQRCTNIPVLRNDPDFKCRRCRGDTPALQTQDTTLTIGDRTYEVVNDFCYLGDIFGNSGVNKNQVYLLHVYKLAMTAVSEIETDG